MFEIPEKKEVTKDLMPHVTSIFYDQRNYGQQLNCRLSLTAKARIKVEYSFRILKIPDSLIPDSRLLIPDSRSEAESELSREDSRFQTQDS